MHRSYNPPLPSSLMPPRPLRLVIQTLLVVALSLLGAGCKDKHALAVKKAPPLVVRLFPIIKRDIEQVRSGMPEGAKLFGTYVDEDPAGDPEGLRRGIIKIRQGVKALAFAKSTFFVFASMDGIIRRSETDPDLAAGSNLVKELPGMAPLFKTKKGLVESFGYVKGLRGVQHGGDLQWVVGSPVLLPSGKHVGGFVSGWSMRKYAEYLEADSRRHLQSVAKDKTKPIPLVYVFLVQGSKAWGGPVTPQVNADAMAQLNLSEKAAGGLFTGDITIEGRKFAVAAKPAKDFGSGTVLAVMVSEF